MRTHNPDTPTARDWITAGIAAPAIVFGIPALAEITVRVVLR
ncbi:hypothetical protein [Microbacterium sp. Yaish 1]|nr:hypothetical protein [Microbacterium sp. Yaish 1]